MKRASLTLAALLASAALAPAALADRAAVASTFTLKAEPQVFPANICGVDYTVTETTNVVVHVTDFLDTPNPMDVFNAHEEGTITLTPDDPSLPSYSGRVNARFGGTSSPNEDGVTSILRFNLTGSDGSTFRPRVTTHLTIVGGVLIVEVEKISCE